MKIRLLIIIIGAVVTAFTIHHFKEQQSEPRRGRSRPRFEDSRPRPQFPPPGRQSRRGGPGRLQVLELHSQFDQDSDGRLDDLERARARNAVKKMRAGGAGMPGGPPPNQNQPKPGAKLAPSEVTPGGESDLYDPAVLRTLFLEFSQDDWEDELADFWKTDVDVPARLTVDGDLLGEIGVRFRGTSSFFTVGKGSKRSINLAMDYGNSSQRLLGYKTLNLLNSHTDPTYVRTRLFNHIAGHYLPTPKSNYLRLVINSESWGIYVNSQQFNKDFLADWFGSRKGVRWKMLPNPRGGNGLAYEGDDITLYEGRYLLKSDGRDEDWHRLIRVFKLLNETKPEDLVEILNPIFNIDRALWFLALENVFIDNDGYWTRASDFSMYTDATGRLHMVPHDSNETFRLPGGPGYRGTTGADLDPLFGLDDDQKPLIHRLLAVPDLKARYLAHVQTLRDDWLNWDRIGPLVDQFQSVIRSDIETDTRKHDSFETFVKAVTEETTGMGFRGPTRQISLKGFVEQRRDYLDAYPALQQKGPDISSVKSHGATSEQITPDQPANIDVGLMESSEAVIVTVYYSQTKHGIFHPVSASKIQPNLYRAKTPPYPAGEKIFYYVAAQSTDNNVVRFFPRSAEYQALSFRVTPAIADKSPVRINEVMAANTTTLADRNGDFDDWIELWNQSEASIDLSGYYLSDNPRNPRKWRFPEGASIPPQAALLIWADDDEPPGEGELHANFKLSKNGETIRFYDRDDRGNQLLDEFQFDQLEDNQSWGLRGNQTDNAEILKPSPGRAN